MADFLEFKKFVLLGKLDNEEYIYILIHTKTSWSFLSFNIFSVQKLSSSKNVFFFFSFILNPGTEVTGECLK